MDFTAEIKPAGTDLTFKWDGQRQIEVVGADETVDQLDVPPSPGYSQVFFDDACRVIEGYLAAAGLTTDASLPRSGQDETLHQLREIAASIKHVGDYGETFWNHETGVVHFVGGDSDGDTEEGYTGFDEIRARFKAVDGVTDVVIADEYFPPAYDHDVIRPEDTKRHDTEGWVYIGRGQEYAGNTQAKEAEETSLYPFVNLQAEEKLKAAGIDKVGQLASRRRDEIRALGVIDRDLDRLDGVLRYWGLSWAGEGA